MAKSIEMNIKEDSGYEVLYPQTQAQNVMVEGGQNIKQYIDTSVSNVVVDNSFRVGDIISTTRNDLNKSKWVECFGQSLNKYPNIPKSLELLVNGNKNEVGPTYPENRTTFVWYRINKKTLCVPDSKDGSGDDTNYLVYWNYIKQKWGIVNLSYASGYAVSGTVTGHNVLVVFNEQRKQAWYMINLDTEKLIFVYGGGENNTEARINSYCDYPYFVSKGWLYFAIRNTGTSTISTLNLSTKAVKNYNNYILYFYDESTDKAYVSLEDGNFNVYEIVNGQISSSSPINVKNPNRDNDIITGSNWADGWKIFCENRDLAGSTYYNYLTDDFNNMRKYPISNITVPLREYYSGSSGYIYTKVNNKYVIYKNNPFQYAEFDSPMDIINLTDEEFNNKFKTVDDMTYYSNYEYNYIQGALVDNKFFTSGTSSEDMSKGLIFESQYSLPKSSKEYKQYIKYSN